MTWSIIARDHDTGQLAVAVATKFFAVGARVPFIAAGIGAIATQALINPFYGVNGLTLLGKGESPAKAVARLTADDTGRDHRQLHMMDATGRTAAHTGTACVDWCGHLAGDGFSVAGNMLANARVIEATAATYVDPVSYTHLDVYKRQAGGDKRGKQSAALLIHGEDRWSDLDLRVDDHLDPLAELERLEQVSRERWVHFRPFLPGHADPVGVTDRTTIEAGIARSRASET